jgi:hypothetical protein
LTALGRPVAAGASVAASPADGYIWLLSANLSVLANELFNCFASQKTDVR